MGNRRRKKHIDWAEFQGNYAVVNRNELEAIITGYRDGLLRKDELRVYAAGVEARALHEKSRVDLHRILNVQGTRRRRISAGVIESCTGTIDGVLEGIDLGHRVVPVSRKMLKLIARGGCACTEAMVLLFYCLQRMRQRTRYRRLRRDERYARFTYAMLSERCGAERASISRAVSRLRRRGYLRTMPVQQRNVNAYGQLFVDGPEVSLTPQHELVEPLPKRTTPTTSSNTTPLGFATSLRKKDPKKRIQNGRTGTASKNEDFGNVSEVLRDAARRDPNIRSFLLRAQRATEELADDVA